MIPNCHINADYVGNWTLTEANDSKCFKSCAGFVITFGSIPVLWKSKQIQEICLSTMESKYISLFIVMHLLIFLCSLLFQIDATFDLRLNNRISLILTVLEDNSAALALATTDPQLKIPCTKFLAL